MSEPFVGSLGLVRRFRGSQCVWLMQAIARTLRLPQSERLEGESYRDAIDREVAWVLNLNRGRDYIVSQVPRAHFQGVIETSPETSQYVVVELFVVDLFGKSSQATLDADATVRWLSWPEVVSGGLADLRIDPFQSQILKKTEAIGPGSH